MKEVWERLKAYFNPRTPCGVRHAVLSVSWLISSFQSTHPLRGATGRRPRGHLDGNISIHAPLAGCDADYFAAEEDRFISIHAPLAGCDASVSTATTWTRYFNPRTPCGVRLCSPGRCRRSRNFNPRTPCGVRPAKVVYQGGEAYISIHAPLAGCDAEQGRPAKKHRRFQSTHPLRGATVPRLPKGHVCIISIHAPLAGCDVGFTILRIVKKEFQSTHPLRGATFQIEVCKPLADISIHAPLAGCDWYKFLTFLLRNNFNPRTPCGVRLPRCLRLP